MARTDIGRVIFRLTPILLLLSDCHDMGLDPEGPGKLWPCISAEGIRLGDRQEKVLAVLGTPTTQGFATGSVRSWRHYSYYSAGELRLRFLFLETSEDFGPVDAITCGPAYQGNTTEGLGIGSTRADVHKVYGVPARSASQPDPPVISDSYCISERRLEIEYTNSVAISFTFGYFLPWPKEDPRNPCGGKQ